MNGERFRKVVFHESRGELTKELGKGREWKGFGYREGEGKGLHCLKRQKSGTRLETVCSGGAMVTKPHACGRGERIELKEGGVYFC